MLSLVEQFFELPFPALGFVYLVVFWIVQWLQIKYTKKGGIIRMFLIINFIVLVICTIGMCVYAIIMLVEYLKN